MRVRATVALPAMALGLLWAAPAAAQTIDVFEGHSIQKAVNRAAAGDVIAVHPGVYQESVHIKKHNLTLRGSGASGENRTVLERGHDGDRCFHGKVGICIRDRHKRRVVGTHVTGFRIRNFVGAGAVGIRSRHTVFTHDVFVHDGEFGLAIIHSRATKLVANRAARSGEAGFYLADTAHAKARVRDNVATHNELGFFFRDASHGIVAGNRARGNCVGIVLFDTDSPGGVKHWNIRFNRLVRNNRYCPGVAGAGILLAGAIDNIVRDNRVLQNHRAHAVLFPPGGIVLVDSSDAGGGTPARNKIKSNSAFDNHPDDIFWDGTGSGNTFVDNLCGTSRPDGLCN